MNSGATLAESAENFLYIPRERMYMEVFGKVENKNAPVVYRCEIPNYWTDDLMACIKLGKRREAGWGFPFGDWGRNPAMIVDAMEVYQAVCEEWRATNAS